MLAHLVRLIKRIGILIPGIVLTYVAVKGIFPSIDRLLSSDALAIFVTYVITAYILIPAAIRLIRIVVKPKSIPYYSTTPDGLACDPINIGIVGTREELIKAMSAAGWYQADRKTLKNIARSVMATLLYQPYPNAPFSSLYLFGRSQDIGFELPVGDSPSERHHVRFWAVTYTTDPRYRDHVFFWQKHHHAETPERVFWVGAVSLDTGLGIVRHNAQISHMIHPDTNSEREFLANELQKTGLVKKTRVISATKPYKTANRIWTSVMHADGKIKICVLKAI